MTDGRDENGNGTQAEEFIQVVVTRALTLSGAGRGYESRCMPVVEVRNLGNRTVYQVLVEIEYTGADGGKSYSSTLHNKIDRDESDLKHVEPLQISNCAGAVGTLTIPHCTLEDGIDCRHMITASGRGRIPLSMRREPGGAMPGGGNLNGN